MSKNIYQIVKEYLKKNGYGGLYNAGEGYFGCGCEIDDLFACDKESDFRTCQAGYKASCDDKCKHGDEKEFNDWHIQKKKPE